MISFISRLPSFPEFACLFHDSLVNATLSFARSAILLIFAAWTLRDRLVTAALLEAGIPAMSLQPAASAVCRGGALVSLATGPINVRAGECAPSDRALNRTVTRDVLLPTLLSASPSTGLCHGGPAENKSRLQGGHVGTKASLTRLGETSLSTCSSPAYCSPSCWSLLLFLLPLLLILSFRSSSPLEWIRRRFSGTHFL